MIDTLMALWNQDRRKRARQVILTFFLMCIGISLLFVITNRLVKSQHQHQQSSLGSANPTVPTFGNTVVPDVTPTVSVVVGAQPTPGATATQPTPGVTTTLPTPGATMTLPTPGATATQPCVGTPASATNQTSSLYAAALLQQVSSPTPTPHHGSGTPGAPVKHFDGGGGPIDTGTPIPPTPTPISQSTPPANKPPGWVPSCTTSNSISIITNSDVLAMLLQNMWLILGISLLGTVVFYGTIFAVKRHTRT